MFYIEHKRVFCGRVKWSGGGDIERIRRLQHPTEYRILSTLNSLSFCLSRSRRRLNVC